MVNRQDNSENQNRFLLNINSTQVNASAICNCTPTAVSKIEFSVLCNCLDACLKLSRHVPQFGVSIVPPPNARRRRR